MSKIGYFGPYKITYDSDKHRIDAYGSIWLISAPKVQPTMSVTIQYSKFKSTGGDYLSALANLGDPWDILAATGQVVQITPGAEGRWGAYSPSLALSRKGARGHDSCGFLRWFPTPGKALFSFLIDPLPAGATVTIEKDGKTGTGENLDAAEKDLGRSVFERLQTEAKKRGLSFDIRLRAPFAEATAQAFNQDLAATCFSLLERLPKAQ